MIVGTETHHGSEFRVYWGEFYLGPRSPRIQSSCTGTLNPIYTSSKNPRSPFQQYNPRDFLGVYWGSVFVGCERPGNAASTAPDAKKPGLSTEPLEQASRKSKSQREACRFFAVIVILLAMGVFSSFVGSISTLADTFRALGLRVQGTLHPQLTPQLKTLQPDLQRQHGEQHPRGACGPAAEDEQDAPVLYRKELVVPPLNLNPKPKQNPKP